MVELVKELLSIQFELSFSILYVFNMGLVTGLLI